MRTIKFRGYDKKSKKFLFLEIAKDHLSLPQIVLADIDQWQQHTGLKDSAGKEIYEGDIVKFLGKTKRDKIRTYKVIWQEDRCRFIGEHLAYENQYQAIRKFEIDHVIVGNIHENKELLDVN